MLVSELADSFLEANGNTFSANTLRAYRYDLNLFAGAFPELDCSGVGVEHLRARSLARRRIWLRLRLPGGRLRCARASAGPIGKV